MSPAAVPPLPGAGAGRDPLAVTVIDTVAVFCGDEESLITTDVVPVATPLIVKIDPETEAVATALFGCACIE
jgi:hypothetical protein